DRRAFRRPQPALFAWKPRVFQSSVGLTWAKSCRLRFDLIVMTAIYSRDRLYLAIISISVRAGPGDAAMGTVWGKLFRNATPPANDSQAPAIAYAPAEEPSP